MSMKRILGTMLATRMAGRGRRRGALGSASALGLLGSRRRIGRSGMGSKLGLAALGYMAYQAYQSHQKSQGTQTQHAGHTSSHGTSGGGLLDKVKDAANEILGGGSASQSSSTATAQTAEPDAQDLKASEEAAERFSEDEALLMIRAMITAAYADGSLSQDERARIVQAIDDADATADERATMEREIANPKPLDDLLAQVNDDETAEEFYFASRAAIDGDSEGDRHYLRTLQQHLNLSQEQVDEADAIAS